MADAINDRLIGSINRNGNTGILDTTDTLIAETNIFDQIDGFSTGNPFPGLNVSSGIANVSRALQDLVANATVGFIHLNIGFDTVTASVPSSDTVYVLKRSTLAITYLLSFSILILISAAGMFALISNGEPSSNDFSELLLATRNPRLDAVARTVKEDPHISARLRLMFGAVTMPDGEVEAVFGVPSEQKVAALRRLGIERKCVQLDGFHVAESDHQRRTRVRFKKARISPRWWMYHAWISCPFFPAVIPGVASIRARDMVHWSKTFSSPLAFKFPILESTITVSQALPA
ncbi:hypothetical protein K438DRAFT_809539 [Mycena galopus ATCC 62051]|nr:hypothetical protein K438DRAFT_809539 [Mycena galopus ATCC 62051]